MNKKSKPLFSDFSTRIKRRKVYFQMDSDCRSDIVLSSYEVVHENLFILYRKLHSQVTPYIQRNVGSVANLDTIHLYMKFKLEILELPIT